MCFHSFSLFCEIGSFRLGSHAATTAASQNHGLPVANPYRYSASPPTCPECGSRPRHAATTADNQFTHRHRPSQTGTKTVATTSTSSSSSPISGVSITQPHLLTSYPRPTSRLAPTGHNHHPVPRHRSQIRADRLRPHLAQRRPPTPTKRNHRVCSTPKYPRSRPTIHAKPP